MVVPYFILRGRSNKLVIFKSRRMSRSSFKGGRKDPPAAIKGRETTLA
jgi:hypothetical protein